MIRILWNVFVIFLVLHLLAIVAFAGWLRASGRLDRARMQQVVAMFEPTISAEQTRLEEQDQDAQRQEKKDRELALLKESAKPPTTVDQRLRQGREGDALAQQKLELTRLAVASLLKNMENAKREVASQRAQLKQAREAFDKSMDKRLKLLKDENFKQVVGVYEALKADQVKSIFIELIGQGKEDQVIEYLAAMEQRKSAKVLSAFESPEDLIVATRLIQGLRKRNLPLPPDAPEAVGAAKGKGGST
jgi:hypothetical protein